MVKKRKRRTAYELERMGYKTLSRQLALRRLAKKAKKKEAILRQRRRTEVGIRRRKEKEIVIREYERKREIEKKMLEKTLLAQEKQREKAEARLTKEEFAKLKERLIEKGEEREEREWEAGRIVGKIKALPFKRIKKTGRKVTAARAKRFKALAGAIGALPSRYARAGAGRPRGTYKYGMPIHVYKKLQARQRALYKAYQQKQVRQLAGRGLTPEQVQQAELQRTMASRQVEPEQFEQLEQQQLEQPQFPNKRQQMRDVTSQADDDLGFRKHLARHSISPRTQQILLNLRKTQLKSQRDEVEMQRRLEERRLVGEQGNLLKARNLFGPDSNRLNLLEMEGNILTAPNIFKAREDNRIMRTNRPSILNTKEAGNSLFF